MILLRSRSGGWALLAALGMWIVAVAIGRRVVEIDLSAVFPPTKLVVVEVCVIVTATLLAIVTRPRFWEWDRVARGPRARVVAGVVAASVVGLSGSCVPVVVPWLPARTAWMWVLANGVVLGSVVVLLAAFLTPLLAGVVTAVLWFGTGLTANLAPWVWVPLAYYREQNPHWVVAGVLVVVAVGVHAGTCGMTAWARRNDGH